MHFTFVRYKIKINPIYSLIPGIADQKLTYHIKISYEYSIPKKTQHQSLSLWRTIRTLEQQLNTQRTSIDAENKIDIATVNVSYCVLFVCIYAFT